MSAPEKAIARLHTITAGLTVARTVTDTFESEVYLQRKLEHPRIQCCSDRPERRVSEAAVWIPQRRSICDVECLCSELCYQPLRYGEELPNH